MSVFASTHIMPVTGSLLQDLFSLSIKHNKKNTKIIMKMLMGKVYTSDFPMTLEKLEAFYPEVLETQCFNEGNLPFYEEVQRTEMGHLFEHILIERIFQLKKEMGFKRICVRGYTDWNWKKDEWGTFHITIFSNEKEKEIFAKAMSDAIFVMKKVLFP